MRNYFSNRTSGAPLHTLSKIYDVLVGFVLAFILGNVLLYLPSLNGGPCSISDNVSCSCLIQPYIALYRRNFIR